MLYHKTLLGFLFLMLFCIKSFASENSLLTSGFTESTVSSIAKQKPAIKIFVEPSNTKQKEHGKLPCIVKPKERKELIRANESQKKDFFERNWTIIKKMRQSCDPPLNIFPNCDPNKKKTAKISLRKRRPWNISTKLEAISHSMKKQKK